MILIMTIGRNSDLSIYQSANGSERRRKDVSTDYDLLLNRVIVKEGEE